MATPLLLRAIPCPRVIEKIKKDETRKYVSALDVSCRIRGQQVFSSAHIMYEVEDREPTLGGGRFSSKKWREFLFGSGCFTPARYDTPEAIRTTLLQTRHKYAMSPGWETFNFDCMVYVLAGMLAVATQRPNISTAELRGSVAYDVRGLNQVDAAISVGHSGAIYLDNMVAPQSSRNVLWAMITAANLSGARVILPMADCDGNGNVLCTELSGGALINGITGALSILATYYSMASLGAVYALAYTRGLHSILTVVGHSDEGGIMRDVLRCGSYRQPHGGICRGLPYAASVPVLEGSHLGTLCGAVDSILLTTAALVAHCDPMVVVDGDLYPTTYSLEPTSVDGQGNLVDGAALHVNMARALCEGSSGFVQNYVRALAKLFELSNNEADEHAARQLATCFELYATTGSRHAAYEVVAPYFWIEPTSLIPKNFLGSPAEEGGSGALADTDRVATMPLFRDAERIGSSDCVTSDWAVGYKSARTSGYVLLYQNHFKDGTTAVHLKAFDSDRMMLTRLKPHEIRELKSADGFVALDQLLWVRGQSKIPHPAEASCLDGRVGLTMFHRTVAPNGYTTPLNHLPREDEVHTAVVELRVGSPCYSTSGPRAQESSGVQRVRNRGTAALERLRNELTQLASRYIEPSLTSERPPPRRSGASGVERPGPTRQRESAQETANSLPEASDHVLVPGNLASAVSASVGCGTGPARQHGAVVAPQPRQVGVAAPSDGQSVPSSGGDGGPVAAGPTPTNPAQQAAAHLQAAAPAQAGAAGGR